MYTWKENIKLIKQDKNNNSYKSYVILRNYRVGHYLYLKAKENKFYSFILKLYNSYREMVNLLFQIDAQIPFAVTIGKNTKLPHSGTGVIISSKAVIGDNVTIFHQVTIGVNEAKDKENQSILIGDGTLLSAGAKIINCKIGSNCKIGPNTVITKDVPDNSLCYSEAVVRCGYYDSDQTDNTR